MRLLAGAQLRAARALLRVERAELARLAGVSETTLKRLERVDGRLDARVKTIDTLERFFAERGVEFTSNGGTGVRLRETEPT